MDLRCRNILRFRTLACILAFVLAVPVSASEIPLRFGVVPQFDARKIQAIWQPILTAVAEKSGVRLELVGSPSIPDFETQFDGGDFDFAYMNPYHLLKARQAQGYAPLLRDVGRTLYGIVVVRKDSPIHDVSELDGKTVAFPAPNALGASLIPRREFSETFKISIKPTYVRSHGSVYLNVVTGLADAGGGVQKTLQEQPANIRDALRIIYRTPQVAPHPIAYHPRVSEEIRNKVMAAFLELGTTPEGRSLLEKVPMKQIGAASMSDYEPLEEMGLDKFYVQ